MSSKSATIASLKEEIRQIEDREALFASERSSREGLASSLGLDEQDWCSEDVFNRIVSLCSFRDRSRLELRKRLRDEEFGEGEIESGLDRAVRCNLVNDARFADARIRKLVHDKKGIGGIERDLAEYGIELSSVEGWPEEYLLEHDHDEVDRALGLLERRPSRSKNPLRGSYQKLVQNGYSSDVAMRAAKLWTSRKAEVERFRGEE